MEHNTHERTDSLYKPLREALTKSGFPFRSPDRRSSLTPDKLEHSHITHDIHLISAIEA